MDRIVDPIVELRSAKGGAYEDRWHSSVDIREIDEVTICLDKSKENISQIASLTLYRPGGDIRKYHNLEPASAQLLEEVWKIYRENKDERIPLFRPTV